jgi:hypothetical protein
MKKLTRQELYDLLWTRPTTDVARELGVSDVWIGKVCRRAGIPKPPPGYWRQVTSGRVVKRIPLPTALPLATPDMILLGNGRYASYASRLKWKPPSSDDEPLPATPDPPVFAETLEEIRLNAESLVARLRFAERLNNPHPATVKLLEGDERRAKRTAYWPSWGPRFRHASGEALLGALNKLFFAFARLGGAVSVHGSVNQSITVTVLGQGLPLGVIDYGWSGTLVDTKHKPQGRFGLYWGYDHEERVRPSKLKHYRECSALTKEVLRSFIAESIVIAHQYNRAEVRHVYEYVMQRRQELLRDREQRRMEAVRRREEELQALRQKRQNLIDDAVARIEKTDRLRELVRTLDQAFAVSDGPVAGYDRWRTWALRVIEEDDPRRMSPSEVSGWVAQFCLDEEQA